MKITPAAVAILATLPTQVLAQQCLSGGFSFEFDGECTPEAIVAAYSSNVYSSTGATASSCAIDAKSDLEAKLIGSDSHTGMTLEQLCSAVYSSQQKLPFTDGASRGTDYHFEKMFFNGRTNWQEEVETIYESGDGTRTNILKEDAEQVRVFQDAINQYQRVDWPGTINNFQSSAEDADGLATCTTNAAMCCWPKDRQANDNNGNCAKPYDENCVDKDPADNTDLCFVDLERGNSSTGYASDTGFVGFPEDNNNGEGAIHCHGLAWSNDVNDATARYKGNNLFFVSMFDHMYQRGYVQNIPGAPMCGCVEQMPTVSRSDCTQVDLTETISITYDATVNTFTTAITAVEVDFNACQGINNRNNDLWAYMARLYYQGDITPDQFGEAGRIITNTNCDEATRFHLNEIGMTRGYDHLMSRYTQVAGREDFDNGHPFGKASFDTAFFEHSLTKPDDPTVLPEGATEFPLGQTPIIMRICPTCTTTHQKIWYRRLTPLPNPDFNLLHNILYYRRGQAPAGNKWNVDFTLHSSYEDAETGANPWKCPNNAFNYYSTFTGNCSPAGNAVGNQYSVWSWYPGPKNDVAYYVNKPDGEGIAELDLQSSLRFSGIHTDVDIGTPRIAGRVFETDDGAIHISGGGNDIAGYTDEGHYLSEPRDGDVDVKVHVTSFRNVNQWSKAGIMLRSSNDANAVNAFALLLGSEGVKLNYRASEGGNTIGTDRYKTNPAQKSAWLRLVKKQDVIEFYRSDDGQAWILQASANVRFPEDTYRVGLAVGSRNDGIVSEATFEDYSMDTYIFPTSAPSLSTAPTSWDPEAQIDSAREGSLSYNAVTGVSNFYGYGTGNWGTSDSFYFHNTQKLIADGAFDVVAHTEEFNTGYKEAKGGIMIRDSSDADASHAFVGMQGLASGVTFQSRATTGASTIHHQTTFVPNQKAWIRLSKPADSGIITAYYKINDADEWIEFGSTEVTYTGTTVLVGTAVTAGDASGNGYVWFKTTGYDVVNVAAGAGRKLLRA